MYAVINSMKLKVVGMEESEEAAILLAKQLTIAKGIRHIVHEVEEDAL